MECFNKAEELLVFSTEGLTLLNFMSLTEMDNISSVPLCLPNSKYERELYMDDVADRIIDSVFYSSNTKNVLHVASDKNSETGMYCICKLDIGGTMVYCNNTACTFGSWFHLECLEMDEADVPEGDWFCSEECKTYSNTNKTKKTRKTMNKFIDIQNLYVKRLLWRGLNDIARHDAVIENDGPRMIMHWKFDMVDFYNKHHPKYFIFGHRLLANIAGATSERMRHALLWERTVNVHGGKRKNVPKDLHCEHLNNEYKENSRKAGGQLTEKTVGRHSQMLGIGKILDRVFDEKVVSRPTPMRKHGKVDRTPDVLRMVGMLHHMELFQVKTGRFFKGFENFYIEGGIKNPKQFRQRMDKHMETLAKTREMKIDN
ncbi:uncharacterized protein LOC121379870 [Gigantopelta aegis]|uniref:uncharacterized protein LOC121379870 n=1 Tax=Gigantopelta aegis TaxID=1735272 RepID=UPI001B88903C|nr:uncharacterized protein LOC121379870 [Gigantopelta aegis]